MVHFVIIHKFEKCRVFTNHPDFTNKAEWNIFGIPERDLCAIMAEITNKMAELGHECDFRMVVNG